MVTQAEVDTEDRRRRAFDEGRLEDLLQNFIDDRFQWIGDVHLRELLALALEIWCVREYRTQAMHHMTVKTISSVTQP